MNRARRQQIAAIKAQLDQVRSSLDTLHIEELAALDALPDGQQADRREALRAVEALDDAIIALGKAVAALDTAAE